MSAIEPITEIEDFASKTDFMAMNLRPAISLSANRPLRVIIACPDLVGLVRLVTLVKRKGLEPMFASTLAETILLLKHAGIELVICQESFQDGDYRELLRAAVGFGAVPPVIVCADWYEPGAYVEAIELGAFAHLTFPFRRDGVENAVDKALEKLAHDNRISHQADLVPRESHCCLFQ